MDRHFEGGQPLNPDEFRVLDSVADELQALAADGQPYRQTLTDLSELLDRPTTAIPPVEQYHPYAFHLLEIDRKSIWTEH